MVPCLSKAVDTPSGSSAANAATPRLPTRVSAVRSGLSYPHRGGARRTGNLPSQGPERLPRPTPCQQTATTAQITTNDRVRVVADKAGSTDTATRIGDAGPAK